MKNLVLINNKELQVKEFQCKRVISFKEIDMLHQRTDGTARKNFNNNKQHFIEGTDYFVIKPSDVNNFPIQINNAGTYLITESGYLMLVKSFTDDLAWEVQRQLVNNYFRVKQIEKPQTAFELLELQFKALKEVKEDVEVVKDKFDELPLFVVDSKELSKMANKIVVPLLGGKHSQAYKNLSKKVFSDLYRQIWREFGVQSCAAIKRKDLEEAKKFISNYKLPRSLESQIQIINNQIAI